MTNDNPSAGIAPARPKSLGDCQNDAVQLAGCIEAVDLMNHECNRQFGKAIAAVTCVALDLTNRLANDLDALETGARRNA